MDDKAMILYLAAKKDTEFLKIMAEQEEGEPPAADSEDWHKAAYAAVYYGWLLGKGLWDEFVKQQEAIGNEFRSQNIV